MDKVNHGLSSHHTAQCSFPSRSSYERRVDSTMHKLLTDFHGKRVNTGGFDAAAMRIN